MDQSGKRPSLGSLKSIKRGLFLFIILSVIAFLYLLLKNNATENIKAWNQLNVFYLLLGLVFVAIDLFIGGWRNHIFLKEFMPGVKLMVSVKANVANMFMGAVTPTQSGGGPAAWFVFYRNGVSIINMVGTSFYTWITTLIFLPISGGIALLILKDSIPNEFIHNLAKFGLGVFFTVVMLILIALKAPKFIEGVFSVLLFFLKNIFHRKGDKLISLKEKTVKKILVYRENYLEFIVKRKWLLPLCLFFTFILFGIKGTLAYVFTIGLGLDVNYWHIIAMMAISNLLLYFAPTPGGSGIAEISLTALLSQLMPAEYALIVTVLHRSFLTFIPAIIGAVVLVTEAGKDDV